MIPRSTRRVPTRYSPRRTRALALILLFSLLIPLLILSLSGCSGGKSGSSDPPSRSPSATLDAKRKNVTVSLSLTPEDLQKHSGQKVRLYEVRPGEKFEDVLSDPPLSEKALASSVSFSFPLGGKDFNRAYSCFYTCFSDGSTAGSSEGLWLSFDTVGAFNAHTVPGNASVKAIETTSVNAASMINCQSVMLRLDCLDLFSGTDFLHSLNGKQYAFDASEIAELDRRMADARKQGLCVSLRLYTDSALDPETAAALFDLLATRYDGGERGAFSSLFLDAVGEPSATLSASLIRYAHLAFSGSGSPVRVYSVLHSASLTEAEDRVLAISEALQNPPSVPWQVALVPSVSSSRVWENERTDDLCYSNLRVFSQYLSEIGVPGSFALIGLTIPSEKDPEGQAASIAYAWKAAISAGCSYFCYGSQFSTDRGLYDTLGAPYLSASLFSKIDTDLSSLSEFASSTIGAAWDLLPAIDNPVRTVSSLSLPSRNLQKTKLLTSFEKEDTVGFSEFGNAEAPSLALSSALDHNVLHAWIVPFGGQGAYVPADAENPALPTTAGSVGGIQALYTGSNASDFVKMNLLSVDFLAKTPVSTDLTAVLTLSGIGKDGKMLRYSSETASESGKWQTLSFRVSSFAEALAEDSPVLLTFSIRTPGDYTEPFVLWVDRFAYEKDAALPIRTSTMPLILSVVGCALGIGITLILYYIYKKNYSTSKNSKESAFKSNRKGA